MTSEALDTCIQRKQNFQTEGTGLNSLGKSNHVTTILNYGRKILSLAWSCIKKGSYIGRSSGSSEPSVASRSLFISAVQWESLNVKAYYLNILWPNEYKIQKVDKNLSSLNLILNLNMVTQSRIKETEGRERQCVNFYVTAFRHLYQMIKANIYCTLSMWPGSVLSHLLLRSTLLKDGYYYPWFMDKETRAQVPYHRACKQQSQKVSTGLTGFPKEVLSSIITPQCSRGET